MQKNNAPSDPALKTEVPWVKIIDYIWKIEEIVKIEFPGERIKIFMCDSMFDLTMAMSFL